MLGYSPDSTIEDILPTTFTIPMFWPPEDLEELIGTATYGIRRSCLIAALISCFASTGKIGKAAAETVYHEIIVPCLQVCYGAYVST
jgi:hypothetical protein